MTLGICIGENTTAGCPAGQSAWHGHGMDMAWSLENWLNTAGRCCAAAQHRPAQQSIAGQLLSTGEHSRTPLGSCSAQASTGQHSTAPLGSCSAQASTAQRRWVAAQHRPACRTCTAHG
eukprot:351544-Chlamydomonas_euryale.AAC.1